MVLSTELMMQIGHRQDFSLYSLRPIYIINSIDKTKLSCYTPSPMQHHSFLGNLPLQFFSTKCAILRRLSSSQPHTRVFPLTEGTWFSRCIITPSYLLSPPPPPLVPLYSSLKKIENAASWLNFANECIRHRINVVMKCYTPLSS